MYYINVLFTLLSLSSFATNIELFKTIEELYTNYGNAHYMIGEKITQTDHALQAAYLADRCKASEEVILALLVHDIGQITNKALVGNTSSLHLSHDEAGYIWLKKHGFSEFVCDFAKYHTLAKIILCELNPGYFETLSKASQESYHVQKNKFSDPSYQEFIDGFLSHPRLEDFLFARRCDDFAKIENKDFTFPDFFFYKNLFTKKVLSSFFDPRESTKILQTLSID